MVYGLLLAIDSMFFESTLRVQVFQTEEPQEDIFSPDQLSFLQLPNPPWESRDSHTAFVFQDKLWILGGLHSEVFGQNAKPRYDLATYFNDIWTTPDGENWHLAKEVADFPPIRSAPVVEFNDTLYMIGGWSPKLGYNTGIWTSSNGVDWNRSTSTPAWAPREGHQVTLHQNKIWLTGGVDYDKRITFNDTWVSENGLEWTRVSEGPWQPRWDHSIISYQDKLYLVGGMNLNNRGFDDAWIYQNQSWEKILEEAPWGERQGHLLIEYKDLIWLVGGLDAKENSGLGDTWYSDNGIIWSKTKSNQLPLALEDHSVSLFKDAIWITGGMDNYWQWHNQVWKSKIE